MLSIVTQQVNKAEESATVDIEEKEADEVVEEEEEEEELVEEVEEEDKPGVIVFEDGNNAARVTNEDGKKINSIHFICTYVYFAGVSYTNTIHQMIYMISDAYRS